MKARIKNTGKIVNIYAECLAGFLADDGSYYEDDELSTEVDDWSSFRRKAAKDILVGICASWGKGFGGKLSDMPDTAIELADVLIAKLKEK